MKVDQETRMTIKVLVEKGQSRRSIARALDLDESTVRYHAKRLAEGATDGRSKQQQRAEAWSSKIEYYLEALDDEPLNLTELHEWLCEEHGYGGSLRSVQRYFRKHYPGPKKRARRRIETPPGAQAQVDWAEWPKLLIGGRQVYGYEFHMRLSHSRYGARVWSPRKDQLAWQTVHNEAFRRIDGVAATVRVDNEKTAMSRGAGSWGEFNPSYYRYAKRLRFHIDPCPPRGAMKKTSPKLDLDQTREKLDKVGLVRASEHLDVLLAEAVKEETAPHLFLDKILEQELSFREERRVRTSLKLSGLPTGQTLSNFDFSFQPSIERSRIETLATCQWIRENRTLLIQGPPGVGKSHLAAALGMKAIECGFGVIFYRLDELLALLRRDADLSPARLRRKKYLSTSLIIIDEVGFDPMSRQEASLFFRLVSHRYQRGSILITTNKGIQDWPEILAGDEVLATAILDRLLHNSYVLDIKGRSYRLRDLERAVAQRP